MHCDNTKPVYIQNYVGVCLALGRKREGRKEKGGKRRGIGGEGGERKRKKERERARELERKRETEKKVLCERDGGAKLTVRKTTKRE